MSRTFGPSRRSRTSRVGLSYQDKTVIRKLVASKDLDWFVCLQIPENDEKSNVYLNHFDVKANKQVSCVEYLSLNSRHGTDQMEPDTAKRSLFLEIRRLCLQRV